jgi:hypothetical protein
MAHDKGFVLGDKIFNAAMKPKMNLVHFLMMSLLG